MTAPKISVIVPVYNSEKYLKRCIDSITNQTLAEIEIIIVDDGSGEDCALLCDNLSKEDSRIKVIHKKNEGPGFARNSGIESATGEYIGFVDSDDYIESEMYETLYSAMEKYNADLVVSGVCFVGGNVFGKSGECVIKSYFDKDTVFENEKMKDLLLGVVGALPNEADDSRYGVSVWKNLFKRSVIEEHNLKFLSQRKILSEDTLFMLDYIKSAKTAVGIPGAYYCYCRNEDSISKSYDSQRLKKSIMFFGEVEKHIEDTVCKEEYQIYLDRLIQGYVRVLCSQEIMHARDEKIKFFALRKTLKEICTQDRIKNALKSYPWYRLPVKKSVFAFAMKYRLFLLQKILVILRDR